MMLKDADALLEYLMINMGWHDEDGREVDDWDEKRAIIKDLLDGVPTVDAEIVVRCQNCKYHGECKYADIPGWYCADGERRESDG